jgi:hypothetical protein
MTYELTIYTEQVNINIPCDDFSRRDNILTLYKDGVSKPIAEFSINTIYGYIVKDYFNECEDEVKDDEQ